MKVRRIVTGLTEAGRSTDWIDGLATNADSRRPGHESRLIWVTDDTPAPIDGETDEGAAISANHHRQTARFSALSRSRRVASPRCTLPTPSTMWLLFQAK